MNLFDHTGCLAQMGLEALANGQLSELERLEAAEHLAYCDKCVLAYSNYLAQEPLERPPRAMAPTVLRRARNRVRMLVFNKYAGMAAAVCLAVGLWTAGAFAPADLSKTNAALDAMTQSVIQLREKAQAFTADLAQDFGALFDLENLKGVFDRAQKE